MLLLGSLLAGPGPIPSRNIQQNSGSNAVGCCCGNSKEGLDPAERVCKAALGSSTPSLVAAGKCVDVLLTANITYTASVPVTTATLTEVPIYTKTVIAGKNYPLFEIQYVIPMTGNTIGNTRSRIIVYLDSVAIYDSTMYGPDTYNLVPLDIVARAINVPCGSHTVKILAATNGGTLNIPYFDPNLLEASPPTLFGRIMILGHN